MAPKLKLSNTELKLGELLPELPILLRNDGRLLPQTFQGGMLTSREIAGLTLHGGQMRSLSQRNSSDHQDLSVDGRGGRSPTVSTTWARSTASMPSAARSGCGRRDCKTSTGRTTTA